jgi:hypothetical protein
MGTVIQLNITFSGTLIFVFDKVMVALMETLLDGTSMYDVLNRFCHQSVFALRICCGRDLTVRFGMSRLCNHQLCQRLLVCLSFSK